MIDYGVIPVRLASNLGRRCGRCGLESLRALGFTVRFLSVGVGLGGVNSCNRSRTTVSILIVLIGSKKQYKYQRES